jgi:sensor histidine kinase YesM
VKPSINFLSEQGRDGIRIHLFFWLALFLVFAVTVGSSSYRFELIPRAIFSYLLLLGCAYTGRWICRMWLKNDNWLFLVLLYAVAVLAFSVVGGLGYMNFLGLTLESQNLLLLFVVIPAFVGLFLLGGGFVAISRTARKEQIHRLLVSEQQKESELNLLMSQLSPHFLFNTLNNLYGLSITQQEKIPGLLLTLSDLLRYSVYGTSQEFVLLNDELDYLRNYIELEKIRMGKELGLTVELEKADRSVRIAPMLLIVFVENAFKHAKNTVGQKVVIDIRLSVVKGFIEFVVRNSYKEQVVLSSAVHERSGVGIRNTVKRLDLLYGKDGYTLEQNKEHDYYEVALTLKAR